MAEQKFKHLSVGNDGSVWAVGKADGTIYRLFGDAGFVGWIPDKAGKAEVIAAVDWGNLWCVNKDHEIWRLSDAESLDTGGTWTQFQTATGKADARTVSVGSDGSVWYAGLDGTIYRLHGDAGAVGWVPDKIGKAVALAAVDWENLWCVNKDHEIWRLSDAEDLDTGGTWSQVISHSGKADATTIAVGYDGVFYVQMDGTIIGTVPPGAGVDMGFWRVNGGPGKVDVVAPRPQGGLWCLTSDGDVWHTVEGKWQQFVERTPYNTSWTYTVKAGDNLLAIVRKEFNLKDPENTQQINHMVDLIVAQNPGITRDRINPGDVLNLMY